MSLLQGQSGADVGAMQQALVEAGYAIPPDELAAQLYGRGTFAALRAFQAAHVGPDGHALTEDGICGPATWWALQHPGATGGSYTADGWQCDPSAAPPLLVPVMTWAVGQIGAKEIPDGSNRSPLIDQWTGMMGQPADAVGPPWCAYFVSTAYRNMAGGSPFGVIASAYKMLEWGRAADAVLSDSAAAAPMMGDVFVILRGDGHGHVGLIAGQLANGRVYTVEGNSGNSCRGLIRARDQFKAIVRPVALS